MSRLLGRAGLAIVAVGLVAGLGWYALQSGRSLEPIIETLQAGKVEEAEQQLRAYLDASPDDARAAVLYAGAVLVTLDRSEQKDPALAEDALNRVRRPQTLDRSLAARAKLAEGKLCDRLARFDEAEAAWKKALELDRTSEAGWLLLTLYEFQDRYRERRELAWKLYRTSPGSDDKRRALVDLMRQDIHKQASAGTISRFRPVVESHPNERSSVLALGRALAREGQTKEGLELLDSAVGKWPKDLDAWDSLLTALESAGKVAEQAEALERFPDVEGAGPLRAKHDGWLAQEHGQWKSAVAAYKVASAFDPSDVSLGYRLGRALRMGGETAEADAVETRFRAYDTAKKELRALYESNEKALRDGNPPADLARQVADLRERMGRRDEARAWHSFVLLAHPGDPTSLAALRRLE